MSFGKELVRALAGEIEDDYKQQIEAAEKRAGELAADLIEERAQRRQAIAERDEARDEVVRLGRELEQAVADRVKFITIGAGFMEQLEAANAELERLRTIIGELGAAEAAEPPEGIEALRPEDPDAD